MTHIIALIHNMLWKTTLIQLPTHIRIYGTYK